MQTDWLIEDFSEWNERFIQQIDETAFIGFNENLKKRRKEKGSCGSIRFRVQAQYEISLTLWLSSNKNENEKKTPAIGWTLCKGKKKDGWICNVHIREYHQK